MVYGLAMAKKRTPEQEALRRAFDEPERRWFANRNMVWAFGMWPCRWGFFFDWKSLTIDVGEYTDGPANQSWTRYILGITFSVWPFAIICFWKQKRIFWIGDWAWKRRLFKG